MPRILESDALALARNIDSMPENQRPQAASILQQYKEQQEADGLPHWPQLMADQEQETKRFRSMFESLSNVDGVAPAIAPVVKFAADPDEHRARVATTAFLATRYGKSADEVANAWELYAGDYAAKNWNEATPLDSKRFYARAKTEIQGEIDRDSLTESLGEAVTKAALLNDKAAWQAWKDSAVTHPGWKPELEGQLFEAWRAADAKIKADMGENAALIRRTVESLQSKTGVQDNAAEWTRPEYDLRELLITDPASYKKALRLIGHVATVAAKDNKEGVLGWFQRAGESLARGVEGIGEGFVADAQRGASFVAGIVGADDTAKLNNASVRVARDLREIANGVVDPVKRGNWFDTMIFGGLESTPGAIAGMTGRINAALLMKGQYAGDAEKHFEEHGWTGAGAKAAAQVIGVAAGAFEAWSEMFSATKWGRAAMKAIGAGPESKFATRFLVNSALRGASEFSEELVQDNLAAATQSMLNAVGASVGAPAPFMDEVSGWVKTQSADTALIVLPLALLGAGLTTSQEIGEAKANALLGDVSQTSKLIGREAADRIAAIQDPAARALEFQKAYQSQSAKDRQEWLTASSELEKAKAEFAQATNTEAEDAAISVTHDSEGWRVDMGSGGSVRVDSAQAAVAIRGELMQARSDDEARALVSVIEDWQRAAPVGTTRETKLTGEQVRLGSDGQLVGERMGGEVRVIDNPALLQSIRSQAQSTGLGSEVDLVVNGSNSVFAHSVNEASRQIVQRLEINRSDAQAPIITVLHEQLEANLKAANLGGVVSTQETMSALARVADALPVADAQQRLAALERRKAPLAHIEEARREVELRQRIQSIANGEGDEAAMREIAVELAVADVIARDKSGQRTGFRAGAVSAALDSAISKAVTPGEVRALGKFRAFLRSVRAWVRSVLGTVAGFQKAKRDGKLSDGDAWNTWLDKVTGVTEQSKYDQELAAELMASNADGLSYQAPSDLAFSLSAGRVTQAQDAEYMKAVESGDMVAAQRMVDEAAKSAGAYDQVFYFGARKEGQEIKTIGTSLFVTDDEEAAQDYGHSNNSPQRFYLFGDVAEIGDTGIDWSASKWNEYHTDDGDDYQDIDFGQLLGHRGHREWLAKVLKKDGWSALRFEGDVSSYSQIEHDSWLVVDDTMIKSADPVTYDDQGNVIPLSKRFDSGSDIRGDMSFDTSAPSLGASFSISPSRNLELVQSAIDSQLSRDPDKRLQLAAKAMQKLEGLRQRWTEDSWTALGHYKRPLVEKRSKASLDKEQAMRQGTALDRILSEKGYSSADANRSADSKDYEAWQRFQESKDLLLKNGMSEADAEELAGNSASTWRKNLVNAVRDSITEAKAEAQAWRDDYDAKQSKDWNPRAALVRDLQLLDSVLSVLPPEVRGKVGGFVKLAQLATEDARVNELQRRVSRMDTLLEDYIAKEYRERIDNLLEKASPKMKPGEKPKGSMAADAHRLVKLVRESMAVSEDAMDERRAAIEKAMTEDAANMPDLLERAQVLELFGGFDKLPASELSVAHDWLAGVVASGRNRWKMVEEARLAEQKARAKQLKADTGKSGDPVELQNAIEAEKTLAKTGVGLGFSLISFPQTVRSLFGDKSEVGQRLIDMARRATSARTDAIIQRRAEFKAAMREIFGTKDQAKIDEAMWEHSQVTGKLGVTVKWSELTTKSERVPRDVVERMMQDRSKAKALGFTTNEVDELERAWLDPENDGKSVFALDRMTEGQAKDLNLSQMQAIHLLMMATQKPETLARHGYTADVLDEIEGKLTNEAKRIRAWLLGRYRDGYQPLNAVFQRMYGAPLPQISGYSPMTFEGMQDGGMLTPEGGSQGFGGMSPGALKTRRNHNAKPRLEDALAVYWSHAIQTEHFTHFAEAVRDMRATLLQPDTRAAIQVKAGVEGLNALKNWVHIFENDGMRKAGALTAIERLSSKLQSAVSVSALAWNVGTMVKQSLAALGALYKMPTRAYLRGLSRVLSGKIDIRPMFESAIIRRRVEAGATPELRQVMAGYMAEHPGKWSRRPRAFINYGMEMLGETDGFFTAISAAIYHDHTLSELKASGMGDGEAAAMAMRETEAMIGDTAQPTELMDRSLFEAGNAASPYSRWLFMFASEARQKTALYFVAMHRIATGRGTEQDARIFFVSHVIAPLILQTITNIIQDARNDDDDEVFDMEHWSPMRYVKAMFTGPFSGLPLISSAIDSTFVASARLLSNLTGEKWMKAGLQYFGDPSTPFGDATKAMAGLSGLLDDKKDAEPIEKGTKAAKAALNVVSLASILPGLKPLEWLGAGANGVGQLFDWIDNLQGKDGKTGR